MSIDACPACGRSWANHSGIAAMCVRLKATQDELAALRADYLELQDGMRQHAAESARMQAELMELKARFISN